MPDLIRTGSEGGAGRTRVDRQLFARRDAGDRRAREELVERFMPLARSLARRYQSGGEPMDDLVQVASLGLLKAIDRFDPASGNAFSSYAVPTITGELKRHFRDRTWMVRPPRDLQELTLRVQHATGELTAQLDRSPTVAELATSVGCDEEQILEALQAGRGRTVTSLQSPLGADEAGVTLQDTLGCDEDGYAGAESRATVAQLESALTARSREIVRLRFEEDLTQAEIGTLMGISQMQVSRLLRQALTTLRATAEPHEPASADPRVMLAT